MSSLNGAALIGSGLAILGVVIYNLRKNHHTPHPQRAHQAAFNRPWTSFHAKTRHHQGALTDSHCRRSLEDCRGRLDIVERRLAGIKSYIKRSSLDTGASDALSRLTLDVEEIASVVHGGNSLRNRKTSPLVRLLSAKCRALMADIELLRILEPCLAPEIDDDRDVAWHQLTMMLVNRLFRRNNSY